MANTWSVVLGYSKASNDPLIVNGGDKITWTNGEQDIVTLTLPTCVTPNPGSIQLGVGGTSPSYTVVGSSNGAYSYSWRSGSSPANTASVDAVNSKDISISLSPSGANPPSPTVNPGDKITWTNNYGGAVDLTLPNCVSPNDSPVQIDAGKTTRVYTVNKQKGSYGYSWVGPQMGNDTGTIDVS